MAGDYDGDGVAIVGHAYGAECSWLAYGAGYVRVGARLSVGDGQQRLPAGFLEIGAAKVEWKCELAALSGEIFFEFARVGLQLARTFYELVSLFFFLFFLAKIAWIRANRLLSSQSGVEFEGD